MKNPNITVSNILVIGGTGKTGRRIVNRLESMGVPTRVASRSSSIAFDWADPDNWDQVLKGMSVVFLSYAPDLAVPGADDSIELFVNKAQQADVKRIVLLSGRGEEGAQVCEGIVQRSTIEWTIVRASWFNQNFSEGEFLPMVLDGAITLPAGETPEPFIDVDDIADVAVAALTESGHQGEVYEVTGPRPMTFKDVAYEISKATGKEVKFIDIPHQSFMGALESSGVPSDVAWLMDYLFSTVLDGRNSNVGDGVKRALGREPRDFSEYAHNIARQGAWAVAAQQLVDGA